MSVERQGNAGRGAKRAPDQTEDRGMVHWFALPNSVCTHGNVPKTISNPDSRYAIVRLVEVEKTNKGPQLEIEEISEENSRRLLIRWHDVFNASQIDGVPRSLAFAAAG